MLGPVTERVGSLSIWVEDGVTRMFDHACGNCSPCLRGHLLDCEHLEPVGCEALRGYLAPERMRDVVLAAAAFATCDAGPQTQVIVVSESQELQTLVDYLHSKKRPTSDRSARIDATSSAAVVIVTDLPGAAVLDAHPSATVIATSAREVDVDFEEVATSRGVIIARPRAVQDLVNRTGDRVSIEGLLR